MTAYYIGYFCVPRLDINDFSWSRTNTRVRARFPLPLLLRMFRRKTDTFDSSVGSSLRWIRSPINKCVLPSNYTTLYRSECRLIPTSPNFTFCSAVEDDVVHVLLYAQTCVRKTLSKKMDATTPITTRMRPRITVWLKKKRLRLSEGGK